MQNDPYHRNRNQGRKRNNCKKEKVHKNRNLLRDLNQAHLLHHLHPLLLHLKVQFKENYKRHNLCKNRRNLYHKNHYKRKQSNYISLDHKKKAKRKKIA